MSATSERRAEDWARKINRSMSALPLGVALVARAVGDGIEVTLTLSDEAGRATDIKEALLGPELAAAASATSDERFEAFLAATAGWLGALAPAHWEDLYPHDVFVPGALDDERLMSCDDFARALADPARREVYVARVELGDFFDRHGLAVPTEDAVFRALYALTPEGRASIGLEGRGRDIGWLASSAWGQRALVAMMQDWVNEPYDPWDVVWPEGPPTSHLLIAGAWRALEPVLVEDELAGRALAALDRLPQLPSPSDLARAGLGPGAR